MTTRGYALEIPIEGRDEISRALRQAQKLVAQATSAIDRSLASTERSLKEAGRASTDAGRQMESSMDSAERAMGDAGRAAEQAGRRIERSLSRGMQNAGRSIRSAGRSISQAGQSLTVGLTIPLAAIGLGLAKLNSAAEGLQVAGSFEHMAKRAGLSSQEILSSLRQASAGTISSTQLMLAANQAMALGVGKSTEDFTKLMEIARDRARVMGLSVEQAFSDLVTGLGRGSTEILDNLGITVRLEEATRAYAESIGKTAKELSFEERKLAVVSAALAQGEASMNRAALATRTQAEEYAKMRAELSDTTDELLIGLLPVMAKMLSIFNALPGPVKTATIALAGIGLAIGPVASALGVLASGIGLATTAIGHLIVAEKRAILVNRLMSISIRGVLIASGIGLAIVAITLLAQAWAGNWGNIREKTRAAIDFIKRHFDKILLFLGPAGWLILGLKRLAGGWSELWGKIKDTTAAIVNPIIAIINGLIEAINKIPGVDIGKLGKIGGGPGAETSPIPQAHRGAITRSAGLVSVLPNEAIIPFGRGGMPAFGGRVVNVTQHFHELTIRDESDIDALADRIRTSLEGVR